MRVWMPLICFAVPGGITQQVIRPSRDIRPNSQGGFFSSAWDVPVLPLLAQCLCIRSTAFRPASEMQDFGPSLGFRFSSYVFPAIPAPCFDFFLVGLPALGSVTARPAPQLDPSVRDEITHS